MIVVFNFEWCIVLVGYWFIIYLVEGFLNFVFLVGEFLLNRLVYLLIYKLLLNWLVSCFVVISFGLVMIEFKFVRDGVCSIVCLLVFLLVGVFVFKLVIIMFVNVLLIIFCCIVVDRIFWVMEIVMWKECWVVW